MYTVSHTGQWKWSENEANITVLSNLGFFQLVAQEGGDKMRLYGLLGV